MRFPAAPWNFHKRQSSLSEPTQDLIHLLGGEPVMSGERIDVESSLAIADVFSAVKVITSKIAELPLKVYRDVNGNTEEQPNHRAAFMLGQAPNPVQPAHLFWSTVAGHLLLWGNAFIEKLRDESGLVSEIWLYHPSAVTVEWEPNIRRKRFVLEGQGQRAVFDEERILHLFGFTTDGLVGRSPISQARQMLGTAKARSRFEAEVYAQKPFLAGVIQHPGQIHDTVKVRESWSAIYGGGDRGVVATSSGRHSVAVLEEGASFQQLTAPLEDMQFVESQQMSKRDIAALFGLPPSYLGGSTGDSLTYQTVESNKIQLATMAIAPVTTNMQKFLGFDRGLFPFPSWYPEFSLEAMLRGDSASRADFYTKMFSISDAQGKRALSVDEIRALENRPPASADPATIALMAQLAQPADEEEAGVAE